VLQGPIDHPINDATYDAEDLPGVGVDFSGILTATDGDGDPLLGGFPPSSFSVDIEDDVPVATPLEYGENQQPVPLVSAQVDEDELPGGIGDGDSEGTSVSGASGTLSSLVSFGADGPGTFGLNGSPANISTLEAQGLTSGGTPLTYSVVGNELFAMAGLDPVFTLTINPDGGYTFELQGPLDHPLPGSTDDGQLLNLPIDLSGVLTASDGDGDTLNGFAPGTFVINVEDDVPVAQNDSATVLSGQGQDINLVFVLDFSGSIDNNELNTMLDAVRTAGQELFNTASGDVRIQLVAFASTSIAYPAVTDIAAFTNLVNSLNPQEPGGARPLNSNTDFTDAIEQTMAAYTPLPGWSNQVIFISDGNPNEQTGVGNSLNAPTAAAWNTFVDSNGITVTTIGVGNGIDDDRLRDVDLDAGPNNDPLRVENFDDLVDTLVDQVIGGLVGGNVLLGNDNAVGGGDDDAFGADGPGQILSIEINGTTYTWDGTPDGDQQLTDVATAEGGKLSFNFATGAWSYQAPANVVGDKTETFTYTIVDNDGDPSTATLSVFVEDTSPVIDRVDEDELPGGNTDGDVVNTVASGSLTSLIVGPDSMPGVQFSLSSNTAGLPAATSNGIGLVYSVDTGTNTLTATAGPGGVPVFTLHVASNGDYTFTLLGPLDHPSAGTDDDELLVMNFASILQASDGVNPVALAGGFLIQIEDDLPIIESTPAPDDSLQVDESNLAINATADFGTLFTSLYGGDGAGTTTYSLQISSSGVDTGLNDVATGTSIRLYMQGDDVVGRVGNSGGPIAFRVSVNSSTGQVTLDQISAIEHSPNIGPDDAASLAAANQIQLVGNIVDDDGDTDTAALDLGHAISFRDDAPSISAGTVADGSLQVDESNLAINASSNFAGAFTSSYGADGAGSTTYSLSVSSAGVDSGLDDSATGQDILLFMQGSDVVGRVGDAGGAIAFRVSVNGSGTVTLDQQRAIMHVLDTGPDQAATLAAANLIKLTATITDRDGDSANATLDIGQALVFEDDAPSIDPRAVSSDILQVDESNLAVNASVNFAGSFVGNYGADGAGTTTYSLSVSSDGVDSGLDDTATGQSILLYLEAGSVVGRVGGPAGDISFTVSVNGSGLVTLDQQRAIIHSVTTDPNDETSLGAANLIQLSATITDKDGDSDSATINLGHAISFRDDGPSISAGAVAADSLQVDETNLAIDASANFAGAFTGSYGADGPGTTTYSLSVSSAGVDSGLDDSATGQSILLYLEAGTVVGRVGGPAGDISFTVSVNGSGLVTLDQQRSIIHTPNTTNDQESSLGAANLVQLNATITDKDGDSSTASLNLGHAISFKDDGPSAGSNAVVQLDDDALANGIAGGPGGTDDADSLNASGFLTLDFGADGAGSVQWQLTGAPGGFTYAVGPGGSLLVNQGMTTVLTVTLNSATGAYTVTQNAPIQHATADLENNQAFTLTYQVTDKDGDTANGTLNINVDDDTPVSQDDVAYVGTSQTQDINLVFVLDFSGSIDNNELNTMLDAVRTAGQELFNTATGDVRIQLVAFASTSIAYPAVTDVTAFTNLVNSLNPQEAGGVRPLSSNTDFTDAIQQTMAAYTPLPGWSNQVIFISDGNPNEQTGVGNSLNAPTAAAWNTFVDSNGVTVTTIGVGNGIDDNRLRDVDLDAGPNNDPLRVENFDDLVDTLVDQVVGGLVSGSVLLGSDNASGGGDDDGYGADGPGRIQSIEINGITYVWDGAGVIDPSSGPNIAGNQLVDIPTEDGGRLSFNFTNGAWTYKAPTTISGDQTETFTYTIVDKDGDPSTSTLTVYVEDTSPIIAKVDEDELPGGITDGDAVTTVATGSVSELAVGPSAGVQFSLSGNTAGLAPATSGGVGLVYSVSGDTLTAKAGVAGPTVFTLQVLANGDYTFTLVKALDHPLGNGDDNELLVMNFASILQASNGSGAVALAGDFLVQIEDDVPTVGANGTVQLDDDALAGGIAGGPGGTDDANSVNASGTLQHTFGADGAGTVKWLDSGAPGGFTYQASPDGSQLLVKQGSTTVLTLTLNTGTGAYTVTQNAPIQHANADLENNQAFTLTYQVTDKDGDTATGSLSVNVDDDTPVAQNDTAIVAESSGKDFNVAFVLDSSGSINNTEFATMMGAVRAAGEALFNGTDGSVQVTIVAFSTGATSYTAVSSLAAFDALVDQILANRPFNDNTSFTAAVEETMNVYDPIPGWSNQVFFISDGNPNVATGVGNSLQSGIATNWNNFIDNNGINVTTIGVGDGINGARLQDVDLDGSGAPILVADFDDLIDTLLGQISGNVVSGNVLLGSDNAVGGGDDDAFGADGPGRVLSIEIDGVTYTWNGAGTIAVSTGGNIAGSQLTNIATDLGGKLSFNFTNGTWSYTAPQSVSADTSESFGYVIIDKDGDPSQATLTVNIEDAASVIGQVDEDELPGGITDGDAQTTVASGSLTDLLVGNGPATFGLHSSPAFLPSLTSDGVAVTYNVVGNTLTAMAGAATIFTLVLQANGAYTFTLTGPLDHPIANGNDNEILTLNLTEAVKATNGGNPVPLAGDLLIQVEDDVPIAFTPVSALLVDQVAGTRFITEGLRFESSAGGDGPGEVNFSIVQGAAARDASGNLLSMNGQQLYLFYGSDQSIIEAKTSVNGTVGYRIDMDASTDSYTLTTYGPIANGTEVSATNLTGVGGGNVRYKGLIDMGGTSFDALLSTTSGNSVNTNSTDIGISDGNSFKDGEQVRIDLVNGLTLNAGNTTGFTYASHNTTNRFAQKLAWVSPSGGGTATLIISVLLADNDYTFIGDASGETTRNLATSNIRVYAIESGVEVDKTGLVTLSDLGNSVRISGMQEGWWYEVTTSAGSSFSAVQIEGDTNQTFKLGFFEYDQASTGQPINLSHNIVGIDGDGDSVTSTLKATLVPDSLSVDGGAGIDNLVGTAQADYLFGNGGNDTLSGLAGNDVLSGGTGDDILIGGLGNDVLAGGSGADIFRWLGGDTTGADKVLDFKPSEGDKLDLTQLLVGESYTADSLDDFLQFSVVDNSTVISVSPTAGGAATTTIELTGFNVAVEYGVTPGGGGIISAGADTASVINGLLGDNALQVA
jgi:T1SS-143 domain-containing protein